MAKQTFTTGQVLTAAQMTSLQQTAMLGGDASVKTASYVLVAADAGTTVAMNAAGSTTITANTGLFSAGDIVTIINLGAGVSTITAGTATITTSGSLALAQNQGGVLRFTSASAAIFFQFATPASGDIEGVTAGTGISGGGTSGTVTITNSMATAIDAKGDLVVGTGADTFSRLAVGTNGYTLVADSSTATGLAWSAPAGGSGLTLITPTSTANTGGTVTVTGGKVAISGCTTISLNGVFTSTYDNYFIICNNYTTAAASGIGFRLRTSGTDASGSNYNWAYDSINGTDDGATSSNAWHSFGYGDGSSNINGCTYTIHQPAVAAYTTGDGQWASTDVAGGWAGGFRHAVSTSYDGFTLFTGTHAMTGTIRVYGLAN